MTYTTLISARELARAIPNPDWVIVDCRFDLRDTGAGRQRYLAAHIPGAVYAHLDQDLSGAIIPGATGRHPLPDMAVCTETFSRWGIDKTTQVIAYDDAGGAYAGRLWWMLRWLGHDRVAVLDGGWQYWQAEGLPSAAGKEERPRRTFIPQERTDMQADTDEILANLDNGQILFCDARDEARFRGDVTGLDPIGGHIPGAVCVPYTENLDATGRFLSPEELRTRYEEIVGHPDTMEPVEDVVFYCGSGVTAAHNILAMVHGGLAEARLYVGSWSEWIVDPDRPIETGDVG